MCVCVCRVGGIVLNIMAGSLRQGLPLSFAGKRKQREDVGLLRFISISPCTFIRTVRMYFLRESQAHEPLS